MPFPPAPPPLDSTRKSGNEQAAQHSSPTAQKTRLAIKAY
jgi:hypothetical protein